MTTTTPNADRLAGRHAVVIGGSMAGLVATRVLADHFERVTLIERDRLPDGPEARKGVPQIRHVHVLLKRGETILAQYFPGILDELREAGSNCIDMAGDTRWFHFGGWKPRFKSGMEFYCQSRPFLEWKIRGRVASTPGVGILEEAEARSFLTDASRSHVTGVSVARKANADREEALAADLVVDASGRGSRTPAWLAALGFPGPEESVIKVDIGYATAFARPPASSTRDWKALFVYMRPPETRLGVIVPVENGLWMVTLVGWFGDHPPGDPRGFVDFTRSLPTLELYEAIKDAEICSPIAIHKFPSNRRRRYERLARFPEGLAVVGDAATSFNPIYGQGMTTAALGAATLDVCLREQAALGAAVGLAGFSRRFQKRLARVIDVPWMTVTGEDFRYAQAEGRRPFWIRALNWYTARVYQLARQDEHVSRRFLQVMHLVKHPAVLFEPYVLRRVMTLRSVPSPPLGASARPRTA
jgi:2-polyprenyl-6-methoxyphenol hydroxylase-like FAD-dependent oxidoreductase